MSARSYLFVLCLAVPLLTTAAQDNVTADMQGEVSVLKEKAEAFFTHLVGPMPDADHAVRAMVAGGPLEARAEDVKKLIEQAQSLDARIGPYKHHELVSSRNVGSDLVFLRYLYKGDRYPAIWYFTFYRTNGSVAGTKKEWSVISLRFDTKVEALDR
jgi:hypothetical protein